MKLIRIVSLLIALFFISSAIYGYVTTKTLYLADVVLGSIALIVFAVTAIKKDKKKI